MKKDKRNNSFINLNLLVMIRKLLLIIFVLFFTDSKAQVMYELGFTNSGVSMTDTASLYSTYGMEFSIVNNGSATISDPIDIFGVVNDTISGLSQTPRWLGGVSNITLNPSDTFHFSTNVIYDNVTPQNSYGPGDNIVVIWPKADAPISQSTQYYYNNLFVLNASATSQADSNNHLSSVQVIDGEIFVETTNFKEAQVYSLEGRLVCMTNNRSITVKDLNSGTYIVTVLSEGNNAHSFKIVIK